MSVVSNPSSPRFDLRRFKLVFGPDDGRLWEDGLFIWDEPKGVKL